MVARQHVLGAKHQGRLAVEKKILLLLSHEIRVTVSIYRNAVDSRQAGFKAMPFVGHAEFVILSADDDIHQTN